MLFNKDNTIKFLDSVRLKGQLETNEAIFTVTKDSINALLTTKIPVLAIKSSLKVEGAELGELGIGDIGLFKNFVNSIPSQDIKIAKLKNKLVLTSPDKPVELTLSLINTEYIKSKISEEKFDSSMKASRGNEFTLTKANISTIVSYCNTLKSDHVILEGNDKTITISLESNENELTADLELDKPIQSFAVKFNTAYLLSLLAGQQDMLVSLQTNKICYFKVESAEYKIEYLLAPIKIEGKDEK